MYKAATMSDRKKKPEILQKWVPEWVPHIEFDNVYKVNRTEWVPHPANPEKGPFRLATYRGKWGKPVGWEASTTSQSALYEEQDTNEMEQIKWICAEMACDIEFREELEIHSYPFDVQDLSCCFRLQKTVTVFSLFRSLTLIEE